MAGIEVIGFLASVTQLVAYSINIYSSVSALYIRARDAPQRVKDHREQIGQLIGTARLIERHPLLQTKDVYAHIDATLGQASKLSQILDHLKKDYAGGIVRKYWKVLIGRREREILFLFESIEKEKGALLLCISTIQIDLLGDITEGVHRLVAHAVCPMSESSRGKKVLTKPPPKATKRDTPSPNDTQEHMNFPPERVADTTQRLGAEGRTFHGKKVTVTGVLEERHQHNFPPSQDTPDDQKLQIYEGDHLYENQIADLSSQIAEKSKGHHRHRIHSQYGRSDSREIESWDKGNEYEGQVVDNSFMMNGDYLSQTGKPYPRHKYKKQLAKNKSRMLNGNCDNLEFMKLLLA